MMTCPFCAIAGGSPPSPDPPILRSPHGSAYIILSTPVVVAFLDVAPLSPGHILLCPRAHRSKSSELTISESTAIGFWIPVLSRCVMRAVGVSLEEGSWNIIQANGAGAGQTVPHTHFHIIPRPDDNRQAADITDAERKNLALGEGPRVKLEDEGGTRITELVKNEIAEELNKFIETGELVDHGQHDIWTNVGARGVKL